MRSQRIEFLRVRIAKDTAEMETLIAIEATPIPAPRPRHSAPVAAMDEAVELIRLGQMTVIEAAGKVGVSTATVYAAMRKRGVVVPPKELSEVHAQAAREWAGGRRVEELMETYRISYASINKAVKRLGLTVKRNKS